MPGGARRCQEVPGPGLNSEGDSTALREVSYWGLNIYIYIYIYISNSL